MGNSSTKELQKKYKSISFLFVLININQAYKNQEQQMS